MKLTPASRAFAMIRLDAASSVGPPNIMLPRQICDTLRPLRPSWRYCMGPLEVLVELSTNSVIASAAKQSRMSPRIDALDFCRPGQAKRDPGPITTGSHGYEDSEFQVTTTTAPYGYGSLLSQGRRRRAR